MNRKHKLQPQPRKVGAPKGHVGNPEGKNQFEGILAEKPIALRLYQEDDELLRSLAKGKDKGFVGQFGRDAFRKALMELDEGILAEEFIAVKLYQEDLEKLRSLAKGKDKTFVSQFARDAIRKALAELEKE